MASGGWNLSTFKARILAGNAEVESNLAIGDSNSSNYITFHGLTADGSGKWGQHDYIGNRLWNSTDVSELVLFKGNDYAEGNSAITATSTGPDRIRHIAAAHLFQTYSSVLSGTFETVCTSSALTNIFEINTNNLTGYKRMILQENNLWLSSARLQLLRPDASVYTDRAVIGVTNGNLHLDAYNGYQIYLNHYCPSGGIYFGNAGYLIYNNGANYNGNAATATTLQTSCNIWGQSFNGSANIIGKFLMDGDDGSLAFYTVDGNAGCGNETVVIQSCFDGQDPQTSGYTSSYAGRCNIAMQPRGGQVYIGMVPPDGNTKACKLYVNGRAEISTTLRITAASNSKRLLIGNQDSSGVDCPVIFEAANGALSIGNGSSWSGDGGTISNAFYMAKDRTTTFYNLMTVASKIVCYNSGQGSAGVYCSGLELREYQVKLANLSDDYEKAPGITFHWGNVAAAKLNMRANGNPYWTTTRIPLADGSTYNMNISGGADHITGTQPQLAASTEANEITVKDGGNGGIAGDLAWGMRHCIDFRWYDTHWRIGNYRGGGTDSPYFGIAYGNTTKWYVNTNGYSYATRQYNAVWNDYAECRKSYTEEPGYCVTETSEGRMALTTERLQAGCKLTSDTYGTLMGETEQAKTPIAVAGRVLAYPYRNKSEYKLGAAVCSAPGGTIDIMTRDEIMMYPERIVGTVSEIPDYEIWQGGAAVPTLSQKSKEESGFTLDNCASHARVA